MAKRLLLTLYIIIYSLSSCNRSRPAKSDLEIEFIPDTLEVGYTYWWAESGPFVGQCGDELSLVFSGTITDIMEPTDEAGPLYTSQKGYIEIEKYAILDLLKTFDINYIGITDILKQL